MSGENDQPDLKTKEDYLRQELRATRTLAISLIQWGVTVLSAVEINLYYVRRDVTKHLVELNRIQPGELIPFLRWGLGTSFLILLAYIFAIYTSRIAKHHAEYRTQLLSMRPSYSGIAEPIPVGGSIHQTHFYLFYAFPCFDLASWLLFYAGENISVHFTIPW